MPRPSKYNRPPSPITGWQLRAARAALGLDQVEVASTIGVSPRSIMLWEATDGPIPAQAYKPHALVAALEAAGVALTANGIKRVSP